MGGACVSECGGNGRPSSTQSPLVLPLDSSQRELSFEPGSSSIGPVLTEISRFDVDVVCLSVCLSVFDVDLVDLCVLIRRYQVCVVGWRRWQDVW